MPTSSFFFLLLGGIIFLAVSAVARDTILPGEGIYGNQTLVSRNGVFELGFFSPGADIYHFLGVRLRNTPASAGTTTFWFGDRVYITDLPGAALELFGARLYIMEGGSSLWWSSVPAGDDDGPSPAAAASPNSSLRRSSTARPSPTWRCSGPGRAPLGGDGRAELPDRGSGPAGESSPGRAAGARRRQWRAKITETEELNRTNRDRDRTDRTE